MTKRVLFVRHGESTWNVLSEKYASEEERFADVMYVLDAPITDLGRSQSLQAGVDLTKELGRDAGSYTLIVSPLLRALQTARLMLSTTTIQPSRSVVHSAAAEVMADACDIGSPVINMTKSFKDFDFGDLRDCWWPFGRSPKETWGRMRRRQPGGYETADMVRARLDRLKAYIKSLLDDGPDTAVVVVSHSDVIWELTAEIKQGEIFGTKAENGKIYDVTSFVL